MLLTRTILFGLSQKIIKNHYQTLKVQHTASLRDIKKAYTTLAKECHPDMNAGREEQFKNINQAYNILSDPISKRQYDMENRHTFARYRHKAAQASDDPTQEKSFQDQENPYPEETLESLREMQRQYRQKYMKPKAQGGYSYTRMRYHDNQQIKRNHKMHAAQHMRNPSERPSQHKQRETYNKRYDRSKDSLTGFMTESARVLRDVWRDINKWK